MAHQLKEMFCYSILKSIIKKLVLQLKEIKTNMVWSLQVQKLK